MYAVYLLAMAADRIGTTRVVQEKATRSLPEARGEMAAGTFREAARMLGPIAKAVRLEATPEGFRFAAIGAEEEETGELFLSAVALGHYEVLRRGTCVLNVARLQDFARVPRRKQPVQFELDGSRAEFRFTVGYLTRTMSVERIEGPEDEIPGTESSGTCILCRGSRILDTRRHSYPCPACTTGIGTAG
jgi:hypothetical protein